MRHPSEPGWSPEDPPALDGDSAERLASGRTAPDDAPPGYEGVASLLHTVASAAGPGLGGPNAVPGLRGPDVVTEPKGEAETVAAMAAVLAPATPTSLSSRRRHSMITKLVPAKVAAVAVGALLSTGAAAAAGVLPGPVQSVVSDALGTVGLQLPDGGSESGPVVGLDETTTTTIDDTTSTTVDDDTTSTTIDDTTSTTIDDTTSTTIDDAACTSAANHGQFVSGVARSTPRGPGHGAVVSDAAQSDCGKGGGDGGGEDDDTTDTTVASNSDRGNSGNGNSGPGSSGNGNSGGNSGKGNSGSGGRSGRG